MRFKHYLTEQANKGRGEILLNETHIASKNDAVVKMYATGRGRSFVRHIKTAWQGEFIDLSFNSSKWKKLKNALLEGTGKVKDNSGIEFEAELIKDIVVFDSPKIGKIKISASAIADMEENILYQKAEIPKGAKLLPRKPRFKKEQLKGLVSFSR
jgi:hypothetical protein